MTKRPRFTTDDWIKLALYGGSILLVVGVLSWLVVMRFIS